MQVSVYILSSYNGCCGLILELVAAAGELCVQCAISLLLTGKSEVCQTGITPLCPPFILNLGLLADPS